MNSFESYPLTTLARCLVIPIDGDYCTYKTYIALKHGAQRLKLYAALLALQSVTAAIPWLQN